MSTEYTVYATATQNKTPDISDNMHQDVAFGYDALPGQPDSYRFCFSCGAIGTGTGKNHVILSISQKYCGETNEPVILVSPEELGSLMELADIFSEWRNAKDMSENNQYIESFLQKYFQTLLTIFESTTASLDASLSRFRGYSRVLEELLFLNTKRLESKSEYSVSAAHPIMLMQDYVAALTRKEIATYLESRETEAAKRNPSKGIEKLILSSVSNVRNRHHLQLMRPNQVYELTSAQQALSPYKAVSFSSKRGNTEIPAIRLLEKIVNYKDTHKDIMNQLSEIKIACFGNLIDPDSLQALCRKKGISEDINLTCFEQENGSGEYLFRASNGADEVYDLLYGADLEALFSSYHIVLFLDLNCFYKQYQEQKTVEEKSSLVNCQWYWNRSEQLRRFKSKAVYYQSIYDCISMWLNSYKKNYTSKFEFSDDLFQAIDMAYKYDADVYLYLGYGSQIAGRKLHSYNICNDEYYDGKKLIVYKFVSENIVDASIHYKSFIKEQLFDFLPLKIVINCWKIIKSISNYFYQDLIHELSGIKLDLDIENIMDVSCVLYCTNISSGTEATITYYLQSSQQETHACQEVLEDIMEVILSQAFGLKPLDCISKYFRTLIVHYIVSNSTNIEELIFAYLLSANQLSEITLYKKEWHEADENPICSLDRGSVFKVRNTLYSAIKRLAELRLRNIDDRTEYFTEGFRLIYCPDMDESVFRNMMANINQCCWEWGYMDSRLYLNSKIE